MTDHTKQTYSYVSEDWPWVWAIRSPGVLLGNDHDEICVRSSGKVREAALPILGHLLIGSLLSVQDSATLKQMGVTHVLNMAGPNCAVPYEDLRNVGITYKEIDSQDAEDYPLLELHWAEAREFIRQAREMRGKCLVNCGAGLNRSGLIVAAEAMTSQKKAVLEVVRDLRRVRGTWALANESFQEQLVALARKDELLGPAPGEDGSIVKEKAPKEKKRTPESNTEGMLLLSNC